MSDTSLSGTGQLREVGARFKAAAGDLDKELGDGIEASVRKAIPAIGRSAARLPKRGGLAALVARQRWKVTRSGSRVTIAAEGMKSLADIDAGQVTHPVFGDRSTWVRQSVPARFATDALKKRESTIRADVEKVASDVAKKLERPL